VNVLVNEPISNLASAGQPALDAMAVSPPSIAAAAIMTGYSPSACLAPLTHTPAKSPARPMARMLCLITKPQRSSGASWQRFAAR
jgi:hypothetical protein